jgi:LysR family transcriptional activator of glutamate synthase operon
MFVQEFYQRLAKKYGTLKILFTSNNTEVIRKTVEEGRAITLAFDLVLKDKYLVNNKITPVPFVIKKQQVQIPMGYLVSKKGLSKEAEAFLQTIHNLVENRNDQYEL